MKAIRIGFGRVTWLRTLLHDRYCSSPRILCVYRGREAQDTRHRYRAANPDDTRPLVAVIFPVCSYREVEALTYRHVNTDHLKYVCSFVPAIRSMTRFRRPVRLSLPYRGGRWYVDHPRPVVIVRWPA